MHARVHRVLGRSRTLVATLPDDDDHALGFVAGEGDVLHYVYVRPQRRGYGLGRDLLAAWYAHGSPVECSHLSRQGRKLAEALRLRYNPLAVEAP